MVQSRVISLIWLQVIRLATVQDTMQIMQMDLGAPAMVMTGAMNEAPTRSFGGISMGVPNSPILK